MMTTSSDTQAYTSSPTAVVVDELTVRIGAGRLLYDAFNLTFPAGRTTCLLGPSGIGKSILLRAVLGLAPRASGDPVRISGTVADGDGRALDDRCAYMAQQDLLMPWLDATENVCVGDRLRGRYTPRSVERAWALLQEVGLGEETGTPPDRLSGGMRQRVALARTLFEDRPVVLMDEPFSKLDAISRERLQTLAAEVLGGRTVIMVTHDPLEALMLGHRIVVLNGRPATVVRTLDPDGPPPRDTSAGELPALRRDLIDKLAREIG